MMTKEEFNKFISKYQKWSESIDTASTILQIPSLFDCGLLQYAQELFAKILELLFNEQAIDDIYWWLFERDGNPEMKMWDEEGNEIPTETIDDLWNIVKDNRK